MPRHIALLRAVNLGSARRVAMPALRELLGKLGYEDVRTHLQSGNVLLTSADPAETVARDLERRIADRLGVDTDVIVRTRNELAVVVARSPLADVASDPRRHQVSFLSAELPAAKARELEAADLGPERLAVSGREIYVWHANGIQRSPAAKLLTDARLGVTATARNWNTVTKLLALADE